MNQSTSKHPLLPLLASLIDVPRELWKRLFNLFRGVKDVTPREAKSLIDSREALVLDVREQKEYDAWHLPGSLLIPLGSVQARAAELERYKLHPVVVICHGGKRSADACDRLAKLGFRQTFNIAGGILAWDKAGLPIEK